MWGCLEWDLEVSGLVGVNTSWAGKDSRILENSWSTNRKLATI